MKTRKLRCFIAMAFDRPDTDELFDGQIAPLLKSIDLTAIRVDRKEHNRNINEVIVEELKGCDLALVDLTYARPSVYFEAGFAERVVPVVYTARKDHFKANDRDPEGNLRVHFDLSMRNIIGWKTPTDDQFRKRLVARLAYVTRPLRDRAEAASAIDVARKEFSALPIPRQLQTLVHSGAEILQRHGFTDLPINSYYKSFVKRRNSALLTVSIVAQERRAAKAIGHFTNIGHDFSLGSQIANADRFNQYRNSIAEIEDHLVVASAHRIDAAGLRRVWPHATFSAEGCASLHWSDSERRTLFFKMRPTDRPVSSELQRHHHVYVFDRVQSAPEYQEKLETLVTAIEQ